MTYFTNLNVSVGNVVSVPIRNKKTLALVISTEELRENKNSVKRMDFHLKKITADKGSSIFLKEFLEAVFDTGKYFAQNKNNTIASLIPNIFREKYDALAKVSAQNDSVFGEKKINIRAEKMLLQTGIENRFSVYKTLIRESFAQGKSVFIILPTQSEIEKFENQLAKGIEQFSFSLHSGVKTKKILASYEKIMTISHPALIICTPPFLAIPRKDAGTIILERENSNAYKMIRRPCLDLRVLTEIYASKINAKFIMADTMLRLETVSRKDLENLNPMHPLSFRINFDNILQIEIENPNQKQNLEVLPPLGGRTSKFEIFSKKTIQEIKMALKNKEKVFIFSLRKGLATMTVCRDCIEIMRCEKCSAPLVLYSSHQGRKRIFVCNRCQKEINGETVCANCGSWNLAPLGIGADTVFEEIKKILPTGQAGLPKTKIFKLDKESTKTKTNAEKIVKEFEQTESSVLIGTEMAFFYLKEKVSLSVIASFDSLWSIPNFRMSEKIIQIIISMIGVTREKLIIQTKNENDGVISAIKMGNLLSVARTELEDRKKLGYPPFQRFIKISHSGNKEQTYKAKNMLEEIFKEYSPEIFSGFIARFKEKYITNALIKIDPKKWSLPEISANSSIDENLLAKLMALPPAFQVFVDPEDLL